VILHCVPPYVTIKYRCRRNPHEPLSYLPPPPPPLCGCAHCYTYIFHTQRQNWPIYTADWGSDGGGEGPDGRISAEFCHKWQKKAGENSESIFSQDVLQILILLTLFRSLKKERLKLYNLMAGKMKGCERVRLFYKLATLFQN